MCPYAPLALGTLPQLLGYRANQPTNPRELHMAHQHTSEFDPAWLATPIDRGTGFTCPHKDCGCKLLVNPDRLKLLTGHRQNSRTMLCPQCERRSPLPKGL